VSTAQIVDGYDRLWAVEAVSSVIPSQDRIKEYTQELKDLSLALQGVVDLAALDHTLLANRIPYRAL
jgi:hypothetical protein